MLNLILAILIALGLISNPTDFQNKTPQEKKEIQQKAGIIEDDLVY